VSEGARAATMAGPLAALLAQAKTVKGTAAARLARRATGQQRLYVFGELLDEPSIKALEGTENEDALRLLQLFAYGTYADYAADRASFGELSAAQLKKLRQLSVVSLARGRKALAYAEVAAAVGLDLRDGAAGGSGADGMGDGESGSGASGMRELEDLVIDCIYAGLLSGKLDQARRSVEVTYAAGRDVRPDGLADMLAALSEWRDQCQRVAAVIDDKLGAAMAAGEQDAARREELARAVGEAKAAASAAIDADMMEGGGAGGAGMGAGMFGHMDDGGGSMHMHRRGRRRVGGEGRSRP